MFRYYVSMFMGFPDYSVVKDPPAKQETPSGSDPLAGKISWRRA